MTRILDTAQTRVAQVEIRASATRPLHSHPEALWHALVTTDAPMDLLIEAVNRPCTLVRGRRISSKAERCTDSAIRYRTGPFAGSSCLALKTGNAVALDEKSARELALASRTSKKVEGPTDRARSTSHFELRTFELNAARRAGRCR